jgi:hypothetical protein
MPVDRKPKPVSLKGRFTFKPEEWTFDVLPELSTLAEVEIIGDTVHLSLSFTEKILNDVRKEAVDAFIEDDLCFFAKTDGLWIVDSDCKEGDGHTIPWCQIMLYDESAIASVRKWLADEIAENELDSKP